MWANDSLFLRESLLIPVPFGSASSSPSEVILNEPPSSPSTVVNNNNNKTDSDVSYNDFLVKIDCSIANTKSQVMLAQGNSE